MVDITQYLLDRNYLKANDAYLEMAIGNAAWPIGVTMVGIHARTGREKIFDRNVAHVLNDETQRKYIQVRRPFCGFFLRVGIVLFCSLHILVTHILFPCTMMSDQCKVEKMNVKFIRYIVACH